MDKKRLRDRRRRNIQKIMSRLIEGAVFGPLFLALSRNDALAAAETVDRTGSLW